MRRTRVKNLYGWEHDFNYGETWALKWLPCKLHVWESKHVDDVKISGKTRLYFCPLLVFSSIRIIINSSQRIVLLIIKQSRSLFIITNYHIKSFFVIKFFRIPWRRKKKRRNSKQMRIWPLYAVAALKCAHLRTFVFVSFPTSWTPEVEIFREFFSYGSIEFVQVCVDLDWCVYYAHVVCSFQRRSIATVQRFRGTDVMQRSRVKVHEILAAATKR